MGADLKTFIHTYNHMRFSYAQRKDSQPTAEEPRARRRNLVGLVSRHHSPATQLRRLARAKSGKTMLNASREIVSMGTKAVPMLMKEMAKEDSPIRGQAAVMLRKVAEGNRHANWDSILPGRKGRIKEMLAEAVDDENEQVALNAAAALGAMVRSSGGWKDERIGNLAAELDESREDHEDSMAILMQMCRLAED
jgi:hypothetical protein